MYALCTVWMYYAHQLHQVHYVHCGLNLATARSFSAKGTGKRV